METIKVSRIESSNVARRFLNFTHKPALHVGAKVCVSDGRIEVEGKIVEADWQGNHKLDTAPISIK